VRPPRLTIRLAMVSIAGVAAALWLAVTAIRVRDDPHTAWLAHACESANGYDFTVVSHPAPFWPRYWRRLLARPWPGHYDCPCDHWRNRRGLAITGTDHDKVHKAFWQIHKQRIESY